MRVDKPGKSLRSLMNEVGARRIRFRQSACGFQRCPTTQLLFPLRSNPTGRNQAGKRRLRPPRRGPRGIGVQGRQEGIELKSVWDVTNKTYVVDTAVYEVLSRLVRGQLAFNKSGLVKVSERIAPQFLSVFEPTLENFVVAD
jgi:hypothetical protein